MIKRRFYRLEHANRDAPSGSSSSSGSELEAEASDDTEFDEEDNEEENVASDVGDKGEATSSSGYESEDSSANEVNLDSSGLPSSDDDVAAQNGGQDIIGSFTGGEGNSILARPHSSEKDEKLDFDTTDCVIKCKSVFKCRLCPRIVCLSEETLKAHLNSKRHARSEKLRKEGRLKLMLNDDGKLEGEIPAENNDSDTVFGQKFVKPNRRGKGRLKQRKRPQQENKPRKEKRVTGKEEKRRKNDS